MKKILVCIMLMVWLPARSFGNLTYPQAYISELTFDSLGGWILELLFYEHPDSIFIDSLFIQTNSGFAKIQSYTAFQPTGSSNYLAVITNDSLSNPVGIDRNQDQIILTSYTEFYSYDDHLGIGEYLAGIPAPHSVVIMPHCKENGGFINPWTCYMLDNTPTIGEINTMDGTQATICGHVYDIYHNPVNNTSLYAYGGFIDTDENGHYYTETVTSHKYAFDTVKLWGQMNIYIYEPVAIMVFPDSTYEQDLVLLETLPFFAVPQYIQGRAEMTCFPNPFSSETTFYIYIPDELNFSDAILELYDNTGRLIFSRKVEDRRSEITLHAQDLQLTQGVYYSILKVDGKILSRHYTIVKL